MAYTYEQIGGTHMTELVPREDIENHVGRERHAADHYGRINTSEGRFYILHSRECLESGIDLRDCEFSLALDRGTERFERWHEDRPIRLGINSNGLLVPSNSDF
jgi:hypothetical protein